MFDSVWLDVLAGSAFIVIGTVGIAVIGIV